MCHLRDGLLHVTTNNDSILFHLSMADFIGSTDSKWILFATELQLDDFDIIHFNRDAAKPGYQWGATPYDCQQKVG